MIYIIFESSKGCLRGEDSLDHADGCYEFGMADLVIDLVDPRLSEKREDPFLVHFQNLRYNSVIPGRSLLQVYHPSVFKYAWQNKSSKGSKSVQFGPIPVKLRSKIGIQDYEMPKKHVKDGHFRKKAIAIK